MICRAFTGPAISVWDAIHPIGDYDVVPRKQQRTSTRSLTDRPNPSIPGKSARAVMFIEWRRLRNSGLSSLGIMIRR